MNVNMFILQYSTVFSSISSTSLFGNVWKQPPNLWIVICISKLNDWINIVINVDGLLHFNFKKILKKEKWKHLNLEKYDRGEKNDLHYNTCPFKPNKSFFKEEKKLFKDEKYYIKIFFSNGTLYFDISKIYYSNKIFDNCDKCIKFFYVYYSWVQKKNLLKYKV